MREITAKLVGGNVALLHYNGVVEVVDNSKRMVLTIGTIEPAGSMYRGIKYDGGPQGNGKRVCTVKTVKRAFERVVRANGYKFVRVTP